jgi:hypothetical protein
VQPVNKIGKSEVTRAAIRSHLVTSVTVQDRAYTSPIWYTP